LDHASEPRQPLALLAVHRFLGTLDIVDGLFDDAEAHIQHSLQLADACSAPFERSLTLLQKAELRLAQKNFDESLACLDEVQALCEPLAARPTLERVATLRQQLIRKPRNAPNLPAGLSLREVEVLSLVAAGRTDAEIAERLFVSRRTITSHMTHIFNKIGTNSRTAAAMWAKEHELL
jgi:DNA-binding CsgD family transcriptional regulator